MKLYSTIVILVLRHTYVSLCAPINTCGTHQCQNYMLYQLLTPAILNNPVAMPLQRQTHHIPLLTYSHDQAVIKFPLYWR